MNNDTPEERADELVTCLGAARNAVQLHGERTDGNYTSIISLSAIIPHNDPEGLTLTPGDYKTAILRRLILLSDDEVAEACGLQDTQAVAAYPDMSHVKSWGGFD